MLHFTDVNEPKVVDVSEIVTIAFIRLGSRPVFFDATCSFFFFERQSCFSDSVSRGVIVTVLVETIFQLPAFSVLSCFVMNRVDYKLP